MRKQMHLISIIMGLGAMVGLVIHAGLVTTALILLLMWGNNMEQEYRA